MLIACLDECGDGYTGMEAGDVMVTILASRDRSVSINACDCVFTSSNLLFSSTTSPDARPACMSTCPLLPLLLSAGAPVDHVAADPVGIGLFQCSYIVPLELDTLPNVLLEVRVFGALVYTQEVRVSPPCYFRWWLRPLFLAFSS